jgi:hypothetical protein
MVFCVVAPCSLGIVHSFGGTYILHVQGPRTSPTRHQQKQPQLSKGSSLLSTRLLSVHNMFRAIHKTLILPIAHAYVTLRDLPSPISACF